MKNYEKIGDHTILYFNDLDNDKILHLKSVIGNEMYNIVPHGWGKESKVTPKIEIDCDRQMFRLNGIEYPIHVESSLRAHPDLQLRNYHESNKDYFSLITNDVKLKIVDEFIQIASYNGKGFKRW